MTRQLFILLFSYTLFFKYVFAIQGKNIDGRRNSDQRLVKT